MEARRAAGTTQTGVVEETSQILKERMFFAELGVDAMSCFMKQVWAPHFWKDDNIRPVGW